MRYVALKAIKTVEPDFFLQELKKATAEDQTKKVMEMPLTALPSELRKFMQKVICSRYNLLKRPRLFRNPTIGQWIANITAVYTPMDILAYFSQETGFEEDRLAEASIGCQLITRPYLISLVEKLESATGRSLILPETDAPLAYLGDNITFEEIAKYFAASSETITRLRRRYCNDTMQANEEVWSKNRKAALALYRVYAEIASDVSDEELLKTLVRSNYLADFGESSWDLPIHWMETTLKIQINNLGEKIKEETPVNCLIDLVIDAERYEVAKKKRIRKN